jgi:hypothetical protein
MSTLEDLTEQEQRLIAVEDAARRALAPVYQIVTDSSGEHLVQIRCANCGEAEAIREIGAQWCHEAGVQEARAAAAEARIADLEAALRGE